MTAVWLTIGLLTVGTFVSKALGTLVLGSHQPSERTMAMTALVAHLQGKASAPGRLPVPVRGVRRGC